MGNFALQTSPCNFLKLRISPWEIPSVLLLSSSLSWCFPSFFFPTGGSSIQALLFFLLLPLFFFQLTSFSNHGRQHLSLFLLLHAALLGGCSSGLGEVLTDHGRGSTRAPGEPETTVRARGSERAAHRSGSGSGRQLLGARGQLGWCEACRCAEQSGRGVARLAR
jgi:hypothetical protein